MSHVNGVTKFEKLWTAYGWTENENTKDLVKNHLPSLSFLDQTRVLYSIRGYQKSLQKFQPGSADPRVQNLLVGIKADQDGNPMILKEGVWVHCEEIQQQLIFDPIKKKIVSINNPEECWNYLYPNGLVPMVGPTRVEPIYQLTEVEMGKLRELTSSNEPCYIQVFTTGKSRIDRIGHVGLKLIDGRGQVYSPALGRAPEEESLDGPKSFFRTYNAHIYPFDFKEFKKFDWRLVTTIPVTQAGFDRALAKVRGYALQPLRFHLFHQNCATLGADILRTAGVTIDIVRPSWMALLDLLPPLKSIPIIGPTLAKIKKVVKRIFRTLAAWIPRPIKTGIRWTFRIITYIPAKILTLLRNLMILIAGGATAGAPLKPAEENTTDNRARLTSFSALMPLGWKNLLQDDLGNISSPLAFTDWQMRQKGNQLHRFDGSPSLCIVQ